MKESPNSKGGGGISLNGPWTLWYKAYVDTPAESLQGAVDAGYLTVPATVPGNVECDLVTAGVLPDPFFGDQVRQAWALEYGDWWFVKDFIVPEGGSEAGNVLLLEGVDTIADVELDGQWLARLDNMLIPHRIPLNRLTAGQHRLVVHINSTMRQAEGFDYPAALGQAMFTNESLWIRKAAHTFGWDIAPRLVSAGIWRAASIVARPQTGIADIYVYTAGLDSQKGTATLGVHCELSKGPEVSRFRLIVHGIHETSGHSFEHEVELGFKASSFTFNVPGAHFWWPYGYGEPALYATTVTLLDDEREVLDARRLDVGIRTAVVRYVDGPPGQADFNVEVNGYPIKVLGTNWVPLDALHSRDSQRLPAALQLLGELGCNTVRCWGGNVYEDHAFFDWCDAHGVLVWQDFALACGRYPQHGEFLSAIEREATTIVKKLRNHPSLVLWCGNNENDDEYLKIGVDPNDDLISRQVLPHVVSQHDFSRCYVPSSPCYGPNLLNAVEDRTPYMLESPDRHLWGKRFYHKANFYSATTAKLVSEIGFQGCPSADCLARFLPRIAIDENDRILRLHDTTQMGSTGVRDYSRIRLMIDQAKYLFPKVDPTDVESFVKASQITQAEALKFVIENTRLNKRGRTGIIWWNLLDCWPQVSDSVVDYYLDRKLAFLYVQRSQTPICLIADEATSWERDVFVTNDSREDATISFQVTTEDRQRTMLEGEASVGAGDLLRLGTIPVSTEGVRCLMLQWAYNGTNFTNHYLEGGAPLDLADYCTTFLSEILDGVSAEELGLAWR